MNISNLFLSVIFLLFCNCFMITSKKLTIPDSQIITKIDECQRCKVLTDSFNYWLDKTSRGKFEGGDAAWEEAKLKSYTRSEIRLVEIQEGLCSEVKKHQDYCYALSEETEQPLEKWWFKEDPTGSDLYTWLCIDTLQYCCPKLHYGQLCEPCPQAKDNNICGGNGKCDGEGTRKGEGRCLCNKGYSGNLCQDCDKDFYKDNDGLCKDCNLACEGCTKGGRDSCISCKSGWTLDTYGVCQDINECLQPTTCTNKQYCVNNEGSYSCKLCHKTCENCVGSGASNCTTCSYDHVLWSGMCINKKLKEDLTKNSLQKIALYLGLLLITFFIFRKSKSLASLVVLIIASYIYFSESTTQLTSFDVLFNLIIK